MMLYKHLVKSFQHSILAAVIFMGVTSMAHATEANIEDKTPDTQPKSSQPQQQATPAQPTVEPIDDDEDTYLV